MYSILCRKTLCKKKRNTIWESVGRIGAGDDLHELLGDLRLAGAVHLRLEAALQVLRVVRRRLHRRHPRGELRGNRFLQRAQELAVEVERQDRIEELRRLLLEDHVRHEVRRRRNRHRLLLDRDVAVLRRQLEDFVALHLHAGRQERDQSAHHGLRGDHRDEGGVQELDAVKLASVEGGEELRGDLLGLGGGGGLGARHHFADRRLTLLEVGDSLVADADELDLDALGLEGLDALLRHLDRLRVVPAAEATVPSDRNKTDLLDFTRLEEWQVETLGLHALQEAAEDALEGLGEGPRPKHSFLRAADLRRRNQLHRRRDLLRVLHGADAV